jgi:beta-lactamase superfamily II metal-dependent hydrolase
MKSRCSRRSSFLGFVAFFCFSALAWAEAAKPLQIYFVDVEGGQATLFVTPAGQSLLIDTGWATGPSSRRIVAATKLAGIRKIDYVLITHFHADHAGGAPALARKIPIGAFLDHGELREHGKPMDQDYAAYQQLLARGKYKHIVVRPGDKLPVRGIEAEVISADGALIAQPLPGAGQSNNACKVSEQRSPDQTENARSVGTLISFGKLRILDLGDLTWDKEMELMCPVNRIGKVDLYIVSHHGWSQSGSPALVDAIAPRVAIMDNGAKKGGSPGPWQTIHSAPGLEGFWQLHYSMEGGTEHNVAEAYIANLGETDPGNYLKVIAKPDGGMTVFNPRAQYQKS